MSASKRIKVNVRGWTVDGIIYDSSHRRCPCGGFCSVTVSAESLSEKELKKLERRLKAVEVNNIELEETCEYCGKTTRYILARGTIYA